MSTPEFPLFDSDSAGNIKKSLRNKQTTAYNRKAGLVPNSWETEDSQENSVANTPFYSATTRVTNGVQAIWWCDEGSGTSLTDRSGKTKNTSLAIEDSTLVTPKWEQDAGNDDRWYLSFSATPSTGGRAHRSAPIEEFQNRFTNNLTPDGITIETWVKADNNTETGPRRVMAHDGNKYQTNFMIGQDAAVWETRVRLVDQGDNSKNYGTKVKFGTVAAGTLTHLVVTVTPDTTTNKSTIRCYQDGIEDESARTSVDFDAAFGAQIFGMWDNYDMTLGDISRPTTDGGGTGGEEYARCFNGDIYLACVYRRPLDLQEVQTNYEAGVSVDGNTLSRIPTAGFLTEADNTYTVTVAAGAGDIDYEQTIFYDGLRAAKQTITLSATSTGGMSAGTYEIIDDSKIFGTSRVTRPAGITVSGHELSCINEIEDESTGETTCLEYSAISTPITQDGTVTLSLSTVSLGSIVASARDFTFTVESTLCASCTSATFGGSEVEIDITSDDTFVTVPIYLSREHAVPVNVEVSANTDLLTQDYYVRDKDNNFVNLTTDTATIQVASATKEYALDVFADESDVTFSANEEFTLKIVDGSGLNDTQITVGLYPELTVSTNIVDSAFYPYSLNEQTTGRLGSLIASTVIVDSTFDYLTWEAAAKVALPTYVYDVGTSTKVNNIVFTDGIAVEVGSTQDEVVFTECAFNGVTDNAINHTYPWNIPSKQVLLTNCDIKATGIHKACFGHVISLTDCYVEGPVKHVGGQSVIDGCYITYRDSDNLTKLISVDSGKHTVRRSRIQSEYGTNRTDSCKHLYEVFPLTENGIEHVNLEGNWFVGGLSSLALTTNPDFPDPVASAVSSVWINGNKFRLPYDDAQNLYNLGCESELLVSSSDIDFTGTEMRIDNNTWDKGSGSEKDATIDSGTAGGFDQGGGGGPEGYKNKVSRNGITWYFNEPRKVGQFVNGDWWVLASNADPVYVTRITPDVTVQNSVEGPVTIHGAQVNPGWNPNVNDGVAGDSGEGVGAPPNFDRTHALHSKANPEYYDDRLLVNPSQENPQKLVPGDTLLKTIGWECTDNNGACSWAQNYDVFGAAGQANRYIRAGEILTVVDYEPTATEFRPPYAGLAEWYNEAVQNILVAQWPNDETNGFHQGPAQGLANIKDRNDQGSRSANYYAVGDLSTAPSTYEINTPGVHYFSAVQFGRVRIRGEAYCGGPVSAIFENCYFPRDGATPQSGLPMVDSDTDVAYQNFKYCTWEASAYAKAGGVAEPNNHGRDTDWHRCTWKHTPTDCISIRIRSNVTDCFFYQWELAPMYLPGYDAHGDAIQPSKNGGESLIISGCNFENPYLNEYTDDDGLTFKITPNASFQARNDFGPMTDITIRNNRFNGGTTNNLSQKTTSYAWGNNHLTNNVFVWCGMKTTCWGGWGSSTEGYAPSTRCGNIWEGGPYDGQLVNKPQKGQCPWDDQDRDKAFTPSPEEVCQATYRRPRWDWADIDWSRVTQLAAVQGLADQFGTGLNTTYEASSQAALDLVTRIYERPHILFGYEDWTGKLMPTENSPGHHLDHWKSMSTALMHLTASDSGAYTEAGKEDLAKGIIQHAIDSWGCGFNRPATRGFCNGSHIFAAQMLNDPTLSASPWESVQKSQWVDDVYYYKNRLNTVAQPPMFNELQMSADWGNAATEGNNWYTNTSGFYTGATVGWKREESAGYEHELFHPGYASGGGFNNDQGYNAQDNGADGVSAGAGWQYRDGDKASWVGFPKSPHPIDLQITQDTPHDCCGGKKEEWHRRAQTQTYIGQVLYYLIQGDRADTLAASGLMFGPDETTNEAKKVINYADRWMNEKDFASDYVISDHTNGWTTIQEGSSEFTTNMWDTYRASYPSDCWFDCDDQSD